MNGEVMPSRVQMEAEVLRNLLNQVEVKETVATDYLIDSAPKASLNALDFWKIQRNSRLLTGSFRTTL